MASRRHFTQPQNSEMDQQPAEVPQHPATNSEQPLLQVTRSVTHANVSVTDRGPLTGMHPKGSNQDNWARYWIPRHKSSVWAFVILVIIAGVSFGHALVANGKPFNTVIITHEGQPNTDGVGSSEATS